MALSCLYVIFHYISHWDDSSDYFFNVQCACQAMLNHSLAGTLDNNDMKRKVVSCYLQLIGAANVQLISCA